MKVIAFYLPSHSLNGQSPVGGNSEFSETDVQFREGATDEGNKKKWPINVSKQQKNLDFLIIFLTEPFSIVFLIKQNNTKSIVSTYWTLEYLAEHQWLYFFIELIVRCLKHAE